MPLAALTLRQAALTTAAPLLRDHLVICTGAAAGSRRMAEFFTAAGAAGTVRVDIGPVPEDTRQRFAAYEAALNTPDAALRRTLDTVDPGRRALVYAGSFTAVSEVCGRPTIGGRSPAHQALERKDAQAAFTGARTQRVHVGPELVDVRRPAVVQGVPDTGIAMATSHTYLIPRHATTRQLATLIAHLRRDCTNALVGRLDPGRPCTLYGFVTPDWVIDFGPVEALVYWNRRTWRIHAPGIARPMILDRDVWDAARATTHAVVRRLHERNGYVGAFGTDGTIHGDRYIVHEINPRVCAGFSLLDQLQPDAAPLAAVDLILREFGSAAAEAVAKPLADTAHAVTDDDRFRFRLWDRTTHIQVASSLEHPGAQHQAARLLQRTLAQADLVPLSDLQEC
jgi:hypothetical protein